MREISYRAWDRINKEMVYDIQKAYDDQYGNFHERCFWDYLDPGEGNEKQYDIMQYTGLKDRKGEKIFEGDVLEICRFEEPIYKVVKYVWHGFTTSKGDNVYFPSEKRVQIVGNIYETPELMK